VERRIIQKAAELGIDKCGIIQPDAMLDYADRLRERMERIPDGEAVYGGFLRFADVRETYPWAKSIVVVALFLGHYALPENAKQHYGKYYLVDSRFNPESPERKKLTAFEAFLNGELGLKTAANVHPGLTALRWAACKAGLGTMRRNNFFYTEQGSWFSLEAWVTDADLEWIDTAVSLPPCPDNCNRCIGACPTGSLSAPYTMNMATCVSRISTSRSAAAPDEETGRRMGLWLYGCDACQNACPMNRGTWKYTDPFPGLEAIGPQLTPEAILSMSYEKIERVLAQKFFYIKKDTLWRWKWNAINVLENAGAADKIACVEGALNDEQEPVREKAAAALKNVFYK
jgi:epoxyqueuosine reductase